MSTPRVVLRSRKARPFFARHPWVFAGAIAAIEGEPADSDEVDLISHHGHLTERGIRHLEGLELQDGPLWGEMPAEPILSEEGGLLFRVNLTEGQKTGFYLDQRDNRRAVAPLAAGRRVLDAFCYTGGFGLHAARAGATSVVGIDKSEAALQLARANADLNGLSNISFLGDDVFDRLGALVKAGERFGLIVLDPPKFARARPAVEEALRGPRRLQALAL